MLSNYLTIPIRSSAILTTSYVAGTIIDDAQGYNQLVVLANWTKGSLTSCEIKIEFSIDGTNYYQETNVAISGGTSTLTPNEYTTTTQSLFHINTPISCRYIKVSAKGTGTVTSSLLSLVAVLHVV